ncbi:hypothetical protein DVA67_006895 [Solirubrobacter sp. CPCC 204708]|uniref:DUF6603 domain-containing protein n=1 Tax=Solirubrobacter deserti TaxID=2282478 RepID=A0ABT4RT20_9ACTN|nr:DUF6603 domain-containing protein [Solirubrobacter deserti]MBE2315695.1 hypothetical protein [Solirubrobacter deserti]MDA0141727.1 hypothetical protein [Solirubrobacter deserti]
MTALSTSLRQELTRLLEPLVAASGSPDRWAQLLSLVGRPEAARTPAVTAALDQLSTLADLDGLDLESWDGLEAILARSGQALGAVRQLDAVTGAPAQLGSDLAEQLTAIYLRRYRARLFQAAALLTLIEPAEPRQAGTAWLGDDLHPERLGPLLADPWGTLEAAYLPNGLATAADAFAAGEKLFPVLEAALGALGLPVTRELTTLLPAVADGELGGSHVERDFVAPEDAPPSPAADLAPYFKTTQARLEARLFDAATLSITTSSPEHPGGLPGLIVELAGALNRTRTAGPWTFALSSQGTLPKLAVTPSGLKVVGAAGPAASAKLQASRAGTLRLGSSDGTRVELEHLQAALELTSAPNAALSVKAGKGRLVIAPGDGDGFLQHVLPEDGLTVEFDAGVSLSSARGFELSGGVGLDATLPGNVKVSPQGVTAGLGVQLGPVAVDIDGVGVRTDFSPTPGNLGVANVDIGFKGPDRLGLSIDAGPVTGGGYLAHDAATGEYAGEVHLTFEKIGARAVGLITTEPGFSLLVLVSADFPPIQLGLGFRLVGAGGLLGINRTVAVEKLRAGLKTGALGAALSPPKAGEPAGQKVAALAQLFPPAAGRHVFAPTARIVWGAPTLITIDLALALELPSPVRLVALGRLKAVLPNPENPIVKLQVDALGVIDFDRREAAVDATLSDSKLAQFALTGDMALRMGWGEKSSFLLAIGGFHPRFAAPAGFPALERVAVALAKGDNPKLRLEAYLALTSNTVQFGARVDLSAKAGSFSLTGFLSFDALLTLAPLGFMVDIAAKLAVKAGGKTLLSVSLELSLSGPRPWRARGRASFSILFFDVSFAFDVTIGEAAQPALPAPVDVAPLVHDALKDPRAWEAQLPGPAVASFRALEPGAAVLAHPLATLNVRQRVAPLERTLDRFGTAVPSGARKFRITTATVGGVRTTLKPLTDRFAPAQFTALSDDKKLSAPSFEEMTSGAALGADGFVTGNHVTVGLVYEQQVVAAAGVTAPAAQKLPLPGDVFLNLTKTAPEPTPAFALR